MARGLVHRYLDPSESLLEVLFGLIMALILTVGARLVWSRDDIDATGVSLGMIGCNIAWGVIDAVFYLLGTRFNRNRRVELVRRLQTARSEAEAIALIQEEFGLEGEPRMREADRAAFHKSVLQMLRHARTARARFCKDDIVAALLIVVLVTATALPGVLPLMLLQDTYGALRVANVLQIGLLFLVGYGWAYFSGSEPWRTGLVIALLGSGLVLVSVALGG